MFFHHLTGTIDSGTVEIEPAVECLDIVAIPIAHEKQCLIKSFIYPVIIALIHTVQSYKHLKAYQSGKMTDMHTPQHPKD